MRNNAVLTVILASGLFASMGNIASAQDRISVRGAIAASILSDMAADRQAERDARRAPYLSHDHGSIASADEARDACSSAIMAEVGGASTIIGTPVAHGMAAGWEVEGQVGANGDQDGVPFVCSVRNGLVSGTLVRR